MKHFIVGVLFLLPLSALAQTQPLTTTDYPISVGTSVVQCLPADSSRKTLTIHNAAASGGNTIAYCIYKSGNTACTPALNTAGSFNLTPGLFAFWPAGSAPNGAVSCIANGSSTPVSIEVGR